MKKRICEVSRLVGVSRRTLQYYDDEGLLVAERSEINKDAFANCPNLSDAPAARGTVRECISGNTDDEEIEPSASAQDDTSEGLRPEFKEEMDSYEEFINEYCDIVKKYAESDGTDLGLLADYADYMSKYAEFIEDIEAWDNGEMSAAETAYYIEVQARVSAKLLEVAE